MAAVAAIHYHNAQSIFDDIDKQFQLSPDALVGLTKTFLAEFEVGLGSYNQDMAMIPTFVTGVPNGTETGTFLALDLGGTNLRVCEVVLNGDKTFSLRQQKYRVSDALKSGEAAALFDYLADSVDAFLTTHATTDYTSPSSPGENTPTVHLGLTFSFPVEQTALNSGKILTWTKGFSAKNAIGNDVVKLLQHAFDRKHMNVRCVALVNDTVGALLSRAYGAGDCMMGAIFGTGTNGAYLEQVAKIKKLEGSSAAALGGYMVINTEWGAFNNSRSHLPSTPFDNAVDRLSINPGYQAFEKFVSGMYLGEISRQTLISLIDAAPHSLLFSGKATSPLNKHYGIDTSFMSDVETAWLGNGVEHETSKLPPLGQFVDDKVPPQTKTKLERIRQVITKHLGYPIQAVSLRDAAVVQWVCSLVARRAALLSGVAVATVLVQTECATLPGDGAKPLKRLNETIHVGVDGSLYELYPNFEGMLRESLQSLIGEHVEKRVNIGLAKDGSGVGAALCALQALKQGL